MGGETSCTFFFLSLSSLSGFSHCRGVPDGKRLYQFLDSHGRDVFVTTMVDGGWWVRRACVAIQVIVRSVCIQLN